MPTKKVGARISASKVREILTSETFSRDDRTAVLVGGDAGILGDGRFLVIASDGKGTIYPSKEMFDSMLREVEQLAQAGPVDPKRDLMPQVDDFIQRSSSLASTLAKSLGTEKALDYSEQSLDEVDLALATLSKDKRLSIKLVPNLVAYVGEIIRRNAGGSWEKVETGTGEPEPIVRAPDGTLFQPFALVYTELLLGKRGSLRGAVNGVLRAGRLGGLT